MAIVVLAGVILIVWILYKNSLNQISSVTSAHQYSFEDMKFSTQEFYALLETFVKEREMTLVQLSRVEHHVAGIFSGKRQYLRVQYKQYFFDICAAPFAKDFFVSWRQGELRRIKAGKRQYKTFYEQDTEMMFKESIKLCVERVIKNITEVKVARPVTVPGFNLG